MQESTSAENTSNWGADIDLGGITFQGIGTESNKFCGNFDGLGHSVSHFTVEKNDQRSSALFRWADDGYLRNVVIRNATFRCVGTQIVYVGALVGYCKNVTISGVTVSDCAVSAASSQSGRVAAIAGYLKESTISDSFVNNITSNGDRIFYSTRDGGAIPTGNHYHAVTLGPEAPVSDVYTISAGGGIVVSGTVTVSSLGVNYYLPDTAITLSAAAGFTPSAISYTPSGGVETPATNNGNGTWSITMPSSDITVNAMGTLAATTNTATVMDKPMYVSSFYDGSADYELPAGSKAYTASLSGTALVFHLIGTDGRVIPHGTPAIILSDSENLSLTVLASTAVTAHPGNILSGTDTAIPKPAGTVYVLGRSDSGVIKFKKFTGSTIPAGKAYYVAE